MTERTSERIWRAARAAYESRLRSIERGLRGELPLPLPLWDGLRQVRRDIEYDATVATFGAVDALGQIGPEVKPFSEHVREAEKLMMPKTVAAIPRPHVRALEARIAELEAVAKAPLPEEIARLIAELKDIAAYWRMHPLSHGKADLCGRIGDALRALAQENGRLKARDIEQFATTDQWLKRIAELEVERDAIKADRDHQKVLAERFMTAEHQLSDAYLRLREMIPGALELEVVPDLRYGDNVPWAHTEACLKRLVDERDKLSADASRKCQLVLEEVEVRERMHKRIEGLKAALKPFAEYAERVKEHMPGWFHDNFKFFHGGLGQYDVPMAWFIAALKAYRGKPAPLSEDKQDVSDYSDDEIGVKYDNDGYPDLPRKPTVTMPRAQHEALLADQWQCIRELEAERDWLAKRSDDLQTLANAIRAKTIEECAKLCDGWLECFGDGDIKYISATKYASGAVKDIAEAIRRLAQTDEASQKERR